MLTRSLSLNDSLPQQAGQIFGISTGQSFALPLPKNPTTILQNPNTILVTISHVQRGRSGVELFADPKRMQLVNSDVALTAPLIAGPDEYNVQYEFFLDNRLMKASEVENERRLRKLVRDLEAQMAYNRQDPAFGIDHLNSDSWEYKQGVWARASFGINSDCQAYTQVNENNNDLPGYTWYGGRRLPTATA